MINSILFNLEAVFFPIRYKKIRESRKGHFSETLAVLWPIMIISSLWELLILALKPGQLNHFFVFFILLKTFFIPFALLLEVGLYYLSIVLLANDSFDDDEIKSVLGQFIAPKFLQIIPFLGISLASIVSNINLFFCLKQSVGILKSALITIIPLLLSIFFLLILFFCLALLLIALIGF